MKTKCRANARNKAKHVANMPFTPIDAALEWAVADDDGPPITCQLPEVEEIYYLNPKEK
jgi:hypothetical protein